MQKKFLGLGAILATMTLTACETVQGAGRGARHLDRRGGGATGKRRGSGRNVIRSQPEGGPEGPPFSYGGWQICVTLT